MDDRTAAQILEEAATSNAIRTVCDETEPDALWQALEAKGIETTPGVIYQVLSKPKEPELAPGTPDSVPGLTSEDLASLGALAAKVGGVAQLINILEVWHGTPK